MRGLRGGGMTLWSHAFPEIPEFDRKGAHTTPSIPESPEFSLNIFDLIQS